ncbi:MAG TPA: glycosyltransferase family 2 protein [Casimicrobiaceae bacterium]|nr:glycosyltransferase family 2 protein [Casimicrobiaceae bacterium]
MLISVVIRSRDEAERLRLTLASLVPQASDAEVIVVNDGSTDGTPAVLAEAARWLPLRVVTHERPRGRAGAANAGASIARGDVLLFLDGDTLAGPALLERHAAVQAAGTGRIGRGETFHLRGTRFLQDPEAGTPRAGEEARFARVDQRELSRLRVTLADVLGNFASIESRAVPGIYPGAGPRRLNELEMDALHRHPECSVLWAAASGSNLSVARDAFIRVGGFDETMDINEHRELALRLCEYGARVAAVDGARSYHLTHRAGWRDPLRDRRWETVFYRAHPIPAVKLLAIFWASLSPQYRIPAAARINSLPALEQAAARSDYDYDAVRELIGSLSQIPDSPADDGVPNACAAGTGE